jgi:hypothetical protein
MRYALNRLWLSLFKFSDPSLTNNTCYLLIKWLCGFLDSPRDEILELAIHRRVSMLNYSRRTSISEMRITLGSRNGDRFVVKDARSGR